MIIESYAPGTPSWVDLMTTDQDAAVEFYCDLFGWAATKSGPDMGNYAMCTKRGYPVAGIGGMPDGPPIPSSWMIYVSVADADSVAAVAQQSGGRVIAPVIDLASEGMNPGRMAIVADPTGGVFGLWEPREHKGSGLSNEPGAFAWNELLSRDPQASRDFLASLFGYDWEAMAGVESMDYQMAKLGETTVAGVMIVPPGVPAEVSSYWNTYFSVADTDDAVAQAVASGGTLLSEAFDSPFGRMAVIEDPQGAAFSVIAAPPR